MALPTFDQHLLPRNATAFERVLSAVGARMAGLPVDIDLLKRPYDVPAQFLPHLAFELSADIWEDDWNETRKRAVTAAALLLQAKKGTAYCLREYARYVDADVSKIERPPMGVFSGASLSKEAREAWLSRLPQVRLYDHRVVSYAPKRKAFLAAPSAISLHGAPFALNWSVSIPSTALLHHQRKAVWVVNGVETDTTVTNDGSIEILHIPSQAGKSIFCSRPFQPGRYYIPTTASSRLLSIAPQPGLSWRSPITPSLIAVSSAPELITVDGTRGYSVFCDVVFHGYFIPTTAPERIFHRYAVLDGSTPPRGAAVQFMGVGCYGWPRHYARVTISVPGKRSAFAAGSGIVAALQRFWIPHNGEPLQKALRGLRAAKRLSDHIDLVIGPTHFFIAGKPFFAGVDSYVIGQP